MPDYRLLRLLGRIPGLGGLLAAACSRAGIALQKQGAQENAARYFLWSLALAPGRFQVLNDLGLALIDQGMEAAAVPYLREAVVRSPEMVPARFNLGLALEKTGDAEGAMDAFRKVIELKPAMAEAHFHLGNLLHHAASRLAEAEASLRRALEIEPDKAPTWNNLGNVLSDQGRLAETLAAYRRSLAVKPEPYVFSNLLFALNYSADCTPQQIYEEHICFQRAFASGPVPEAPPCAPADGRRLRIGYVSPDFHLHPVPFFLLPLLEHHDRERCEIFGYYNHPQQDEYTARIRSLCDHWRETLPFNDERMVRQIRDDGIDILVDLAGHTGDNQLLVFACRPAPVQATWLGYLNTTGLAAMDYRITDAVAAPPGADTLHSEKLVRLPDSQWCYAPPPDSPEVGPLPALSGGGLTFGCMHNPAKITPPVIALWSLILRALPDAKLIVAAAGLDHMADAVAARFTAHGVARGQIEVVGRLPLVDYLGLHGRIDINLDTFPYSGATTTCHSLWMGVPVLTLPGESVTSRGGASLLSALGLTEFIAASAQDYADIAVRANGDRDGLARLRAGLRQRMRDSPVMDGARFARNMETAYRAMWLEKTMGSCA